jgi:multiple sugar transport system substrate-binding protein
MQKRRSDDHGVPIAQHAGDGDRGRLISRRGFLAGAAGAGAAAGLASLGLTGCAAGRGPNSLTVAVNGTQAAAEAIKAAVGPPFLARHPKVQLNFMAVNGTDWADYFAKILTLIAGGLAPDLTSVATEGLQLFASKGIAEPLDDYVKRDKADLAGYFSDVHPVLVESMMYQGHLYVLPTDFNCGNMFFDTVLLDKAGVGYPADGWTRDDFYDMAQKWAKVPDAVGWDWVVRLWGSWTSWMYANNANLVSEGRWPGGGWMWDTFYPNDPAARGRGGGWRWGEPTANDPKTVEALQYMIDLKQAGISAAPDVGGGGTLQGLFASNHIAMTIGGGFWAGGLHAAGMKPGQFDVQYFPAWSAQKHLLGDAGYAMLKTSPVKEIAWEFMKSLTEPAALGALVAGNTSTPTRRSMMTASRYGPTGPAHWPVFYGTLDKFPNTTPIPAPPYYQQLATAFAARTTQAMAGGSAKPALDGLQGDLEAIISSET